MEPYKSRIQIKNNYITLGGVKWLNYLKKKTIN